MLNKRQEPIPANAISLSAAFQKFIEHRFENLRELERKAEKSLHSVGTHELDVETDKWRPVDLPQTEALKEYDEALRHAELSFREWLNADGPAAYVLDPVTGEWRRIDKRGWTSNLPRTLTLREDSSIVSGPPGNFLPGFDEDFVSPNDMFSHGPSDAQFDGMLSKVFFDIREFETKLRGSATTPRGAKPKFYWSAAKSEAKKLMDYHGAFSPDDPVWNCRRALRKQSKSILTSCLAPVPRQAKARSAKRSLNGSLKNRGQY
jgi:hypothetical protein